MTTSESFALMRGPTYLGFTVALVLYGAGIGQLIRYVRAFPSDKLHVKLLAFSVFIFDSAHTFMLASALYTTFVPCRHNVTRSCVVYLPWGSTFITLMQYWVTFMVQVFYAHRVWIISGHNRVITFAVIASTTAQFVLGLMILDDIIRTPTLDTLTFSRYTPWAAIASATCDAIITSSVFYYLRPARTGVTRRGNVFKRLNLVFIQMGSLSFINALAMVVLYYIQDHLFKQYLTVVPGIISSKTYVNSMLAVLNARKSTRDQQDYTTIEVPTISTIY